MPLYEPAAQLINYAREIAVMNEEQFHNHFNSMSDHLKMTLRLNSFINSKPSADFHGILLHPSSLHAVLAATFIMQRHIIIEINLYVCLTYWVTQLFLLFH